MAPNLGTSWSLSFLELLEIRQLQHKSGLRAKARKTLESTRVYSRFMPAHRAGTRVHKSLVAPLF